MYTIYSLFIDDLLMYLLLTSWRSKKRNTDTFSDSKKETQKQWTPLKNIIKGSKVQGLYFVVDQTYPSTVSKVSVYATSGMFLGVSISVEPGLQVGHENLIRFKRVFFLTKED